MIGNDSRPGLIYASDSTTIIDTRAMDWVSFEGMGGSAAKPLAFFDDGSCEVMLGWIPPGKAQSIEDLPDRHYHRTVAEFFYLLGGEVYTWDYRDEDDPDGVLVRYQDGYYLDRQPGPEGIHGLEDGPVSECGPVFLNWRSGVGIWAGEPEFAEESISVPYPTNKASMVTESLTAASDGSGVVYSTPTVRLLDTRAMAWEPCPDLAPGAARKVLSTFGDGSPSVMLLSLPPATPSRRQPSVSHRTARECIFVLSGAIAVREFRGEPREVDDDGDLVVLEQGFFLDRQAAARHQLAWDTRCAVGAVVLYWRSAPGTLRTDAEFEHETGASSRYPEADVEGGGS